MKPVIAVINCGTSYLRNIVDTFSDLETRAEVVELESLDESDLSVFDGVVISGAPTLLTEVNQDEYLNPFKRLMGLDKPLLGICLGHQIIGLLSGAKIFSGDMIDKKENIAILEESILFLGINDQSLFVEEHSEFISLPDKFELLAKSESCGNEAMKHPTKKIYSTQFHPEVSGENGKQLLNNFVAMCSEGD